MDEAVSAPIRYEKKMKTKEFDKTKIEHVDETGVKRTHDLPTFNGDGSSEGDTECDFVFTLATQSWAFVKGVKGIIVRIIDYIKSLFPTVFIRSSISFMLLVMVIIVDFDDHDRIQYHILFLNDTKQHDDILN